MTVMEEVGAIMRRSLPLPTDGKMGFELSIERFGDFLFVWVSRLTGGEAEFDPESNPRQRSVYIGGVAIVEDEMDPMLVYGFAAACKQAARQGRLLDPAEVTLKALPRRPAYRRPNANLPRGADNHATKLSEDDVREIRRRIANGEKDRKISESYGVRFTSIWKIRKGLTWSHLED